MVIYSDDPGIRRTQEKMYAMYGKFKFDTFEELFKHGKKNFSGLGGLTGMEDQTIGNTDLINLNKYMYTTYSSNEGQKTLSLDGVLTLKNFLKIEPFLNSYGYWYIAERLLPRERIRKNLPTASQFDWSKANYTKISRLPKSYYNPQEYIYNGEVLCNHGDPIITGDKKVPIYFFTRFTELPSDRLLPEWAKNPSSEVLGYTSENLFKGENPLIGLLIEDPVVGRISLYRNLYKYMSSNSSSNSCIIL
jgi:hypothetical protein